MHLSVQKNEDDFLSLCISAIYTEFPKLLKNFTEIKQPNLVKVGVRSVIENGLIESSRYSKSWNIF